MSLDDHVRISGDMGAGVCSCKFSYSRRWWSFYINSHAGSVEKSLFSRFQVKNLLKQCVIVQQRRVRMPLENLQQYLDIVINTGNVLSVNKKAGQKTSEEVRWNTISPFWQIYWIVFTVGNRKAIELILPVQSHGELLVFSYVTGSKRVCIYFWESLSLFKRENSSGVLHNIEQQNRLI